MPLNPILGQIVPVAFPRTPTGWAACDGQILSIEQHRALFALIGTTYGGDGSKTFALPDLRGRAAQGVDPGTIVIGTRSGSVTVTLTSTQLPMHRHTIYASTTPGSGRGVAPDNKLFGAATSTTETIFAQAGMGEIDLASGTNVSEAGSSKAHDNMQPYQVVTWMIALQGIFPIRS